MLSYLSKEFKKRLSTIAVWIGPHLLNDTQETSKEAEANLKYSKAQKRTKNNILYYKPDYSQKTAVAKFPVTFFHQTH